MAARRGAPVVLVLNAGKDRVEYRLYEESGNTRIDLTDLSTYPPADSPDLVRLERREFTSTLVTAKPPDVKIPMVFPFQGVYKSLPTNVPGCTFCQKVGDDLRGGLRIQPDGEVQIPGAGALGGGFIYARSVADSSSEIRVGAVGVLAPSGLVRVFLY